MPDAQFNPQLDKLVHPLPHADRNMLAGCLRFGQDILAVGKYLEDEKTELLSMINNSFARLDVSPPSPTHDIYPFDAL